MCSPARAATAASRSGARSSSSSAARAAATAAKAATSSIEAVDGLNTLIDYRYQQHFKAKSGGNGMGKDMPRRQRQGRGAQGSGRHAGLRGGRRDAARRFHPRRRARHADEGRQWRLRQRLFQILDQPGAAQGQSRPARRGAHHPPAPEADRRRRPDRPAQCRQVHLPRRGQRGQAEDRRLSVHHAASAARRGARGRARIRAGRSARPDRGRA